jgi:hypothetical protein
MVESPTEALETTGPTRRVGRGVPLLTVSAVGVILAVGFWPLMFDKLPAPDDEGFFVMSTRAFLHGGTLYVDVNSAYGPFYHSFMGLIYRLIGQDPTLTSGRVIVLLLTTLSAAVFAAAVWRVTRSLSMTVVCEIAAFCILIRATGNEPGHPGSVIVLLLAIGMYSLAGYSLDARPRHLFVTGAVIGAMTMTKVNVGILAAVAVVVALVVGSTAYSPAARLSVGAGAVVLPFLLIYQRPYEAGVVALAVVVSSAMLATQATLCADTTSIQPRALTNCAGGGLVGVAVSCLWPLATGTPLTVLPHAILIGPLRQVDNLFVAPLIDVELWAFILTTAGALAALAYRRGQTAEGSRTQASLELLLLAVALWVLGRGIVRPLGIGGQFGRWLPLIALLPALAWIASASPQIRLALRFFVPLAILQILHAYPVAGSQTAFGTVAMVVPCAVAAAWSLERIPAWRAAAAASRAMAVTALCLALTFTAGLWPLAIWHSYTRLQALDLPGAHFVRTDRAHARTLQQLTAALRQHCDTFYSAPGMNSLYVYSELPPPTGLLRHWPGVMTISEQRKLANQLAAHSASGDRVCIVRDLGRQKTWLASSYGNGPLGNAVAQYQSKVAQVGAFSISVKGPQQAS